MDVDGIRREYVRGRLRREQLLDDPIAQFKQWLEVAVQAGMADPTAMVLSTVNADGQPSQRAVLLKQVNRDGLIFYTNNGSRKARDISENANVCLHFPWFSLERQVSIQGSAERLSAREVLQYFLSRPRDSQIAAWVSSQSSPISSRQILERGFAQMKQTFSEGNIPLPSFWSGYRVRPREFEFWQGGEHRLHDRFRYRLDTDQCWLVERLAP